MSRTSSCSSADSDGAPQPRGSLMLTVMAAFAQGNALTVPVFTAEPSWQRHSAMMPPPRAEVNAMLAASAALLRRADDESGDSGPWCAGCSERGRQPRSARVSSVGVGSGGEQRGCPRCKEASAAEAGGCFPFPLKLRGRTRRVSPRPPPTQ